MFRKFFRNAEIRNNEAFRHMKENLISNVVWQSADGSWSRGFFFVKNVHAPSFDYSKFEWLNKSEESFEDVMGYYNGFDPESHYVLPFSPNTSTLRGIFDSIPSSSVAR